MSMNEKLTKRPKVPPIDPINDTPDIIQYSLLTDLNGFSDLKSLLISGITKLYPTENVYSSKESKSFDSLALNSLL